MNSSFRPVAIIGAGPYGLSVAAHLRAAGIEHRVFGTPMDRWRSQMPKGMFLKSEGLASNLSDPAGQRTLARYCAEHRLPYGAWGTPVSLDSFSRYAVAFQQALVPEVEDVKVMRVEASGGGFNLQLVNGTTAKASRVVVATGLDYMAHVPAELATLPRELCSHTVEHSDLSFFRGKTVVVVGGGQSALESAALLCEQGARVRLLVRKTSVSWNRVPVVERPLYRRLRYPRTGLGEGIAAWMYADAPILFRCLPLAIRVEKVKTVLGPGGAWWLKKRVDGRVEILAGHTVRRAEGRGGRALLKTVDPDGQEHTVDADHVIAGTGYRYDFRRLPFLEPRTQSQVRTAYGMPVLSPGFHSSLVGLYFTGLASALCFGPAMRFLEGTDYTARRIARHIAAAVRHRTTSSPRSLVGELRDAASTSE